MKVCPVEMQLSNLIGQSLGGPRREITDADRLADIGLDSLRRLTLAALIEDELGITIDEEDITHTTTVADLRKLVGGGGPTEALITSSVLAVSAIGATSRRCDT